MKPCRRVGLDVTWRCNWKCVHCFYRFGGNEHGKLGDAWDAPMDTLLAKVDKARKRGINHVVLEGFGEPTLMKDLKGLLLAVRDRGMTSSIITNGVQPLSHYAKMYFEWGLDHLHISSHGFGHTLATVADRKDAGEKQLRTKKWLQREQLPFRTNVTLQAANWLDVPDIIKQDADLGSFHLVMLGFLPHYEWADKNKAKEVAVAPSKLRPIIEKAARWLKDNNKLFTIRYHPHCHLDPEFWPYIVNAKYVEWDPWEWNYALQADDLPALWKHSSGMGESVANQGSECRKCTANRHCGGYNKRNISSTDDYVKAITTCPPEYASVYNKNGGLHDLNPANHLDGITPPFITDSRRSGKKAATEINTESNVDIVIEEHYQQEGTPDIEESKLIPLTLISRDN